MNKKYLLFLICLILCLSGCASSNGSAGASGTAGKAEEVLSFEDYRLVTHEGNYVNDEIMKTFEFKVRNNSGKRIYKIWLRVQALDEQGDVLGHDDWYVDALDDGQGGWSSGKYFGSQSFKTSDVKKVKITAYDVYYDSEDSIPVKVELRDPIVVPIEDFKQE